MTDATAHTQAADAHLDHSAAAQSGGTFSWAADFAGSVWGATKVAGHVVAGAVEEAVDHPLKTAAEIGAGIAVGAVAAEAGVGLVAGAAAGTAALAVYGAYRGAQIAATEGVGAIPEHMKAAYTDAKETASNVLDAASTIYHGEGGKKHDDAVQTLENVGRSALPLAAMGIGGAGAEAGQMAIRGGANLMADILPGLTLEPALAYAGAGGIVGGAIAAMPARAAAETAALSAGAGQTVHMMRDGESSGGATDYDRKREFVDGSKPVVPREVREGVAAEIGKGFADADKIIANGGIRGNFKYEYDGKGIYNVEVIDGPLKGRTGLWEKGAPKFNVDGAAGETSEFTMPRS